MTGLTENYLREVEHSLRADADRKRQIIDELRSHLQEKIDDIKRANPERSYEDIEREVLHDFGSPRDLALAYEPEGVAVLKNNAGDTVLRVGQAVGRGATYVATDLAPRAARAAGRNAGRALKVIGITLAILLVTALGVAGWAYYEVKPYLGAIAEDGLPVYDYSESCSGTPCSGLLPAGSFYVKSEARQLRFELDIDPVHPSGAERGTPHVGAGSVTVTVTDPTGVQAYNRTVLMTNGSSVRHDATWAALEGNWTVAIAFDGFQGDVRVEAYTWSAPWRDW